ncbi:hypothetical protein [Adhaeribacter soli]|uniref:hypothetical protein n=1 Tax=Adhaeribacter soli TaxID=2607655 RepID=UPI001CD9AD1F|nr:hypothetical protein [Adhaeribacter soli]
MELLFKQRTHPEQVYRTCDGLLGLQRKSAAEAFEQACLLAIEYQNYSYRFVLRLLENNMAGQQQEPKLSQPLPVHGNIRGKDYYLQTALLTNNL